MALSDEDVGVTDNEDERPEDAPNGLRLLARWFDAREEGQGRSTEVQDDLRRWADEIWQREVDMTSLRSERDALQQQVTDQAQALAVARGELAAVQKILDAPDPIMAYIVRDSLKTTLFIASKGMLTDVDGAADHLANSLLAGYSRLERDLTALWTYARHGMECPAGLRLGSECNCGLANLPAVVQQRMAEQEAHQRQDAALREALSDLIAADVDPEHLYCPLCDGPGDETHTPGCELGRAKQALAQATPQPVQEG